MSGGKRGQCPPIVPLIRAGRFLGVEPWRLMDESTYWRNWALWLESADAEAEAQLQERAASAAARPAGRR